MDEDIEFDVAANDMATAVLNRLGDELQSLGESIDSTSAKSQKLEFSLNGLEAIAVVLASTYAALKSVSAVGGFIGDSVEEFVAVEKASERLNASLIKLADTIEAGTNIDEKSILSLMREAQGRGFQGDQIGEITKAAVGLSEVMEVSLTEAMNRAREATMGNFEAFEYLIPNINRLATREEQLAAVIDLATSGLNKKKNEANSAIAVFDRMDVELNNLYETVGAIVEPFRQLAYEGIAVTAELLTQGLTPAIKDFEDQFSGTEQAVDSASDQIARSIVSAFTMAEVVVTNFTASMEVFGAGMLLPLEQSRSGWKYLFVDYIPALLNWFTEEFTNIMTDIGVFTSGVFKNIGDVASAMWDYIINGFSPQAYAELMMEVGKAGAEGFLEGIDPMTNAFVAPELQISEFEKSLQEMIDNSSNVIAQDFESKFTERLEAMQKGLKDNPLDAEIDLRLRRESVPDVKTIQAVESRVMVRGSSEDPLLKVSNEQLNSLKRLEDLLERAEANRLTLVGVI